MNRSRLRRLAVIVATATSATQCMEGHAEVNRSAQVRTIAQHERSSAQHGKSSAEQTSPAEQTSSREIVDLDNVKRRFDSAKSALDNGQFRRAAEAFGNLARQDSDLPRVVESGFYLGESLVQLEEYREAQVVYERYLARTPDGQNATFAQFRIGETAFFLRQYALAERALLGFLHRHPNHDWAPNAHRMLPTTLIHSALGDFDSWRNHGDDERLRAAGRRLRAFLSTFPADENHLVARYWLGRVLFAQRAYERANQVFAMAIELGAGHELLPELYFYAGRCWQNRGAMPDARDSWRRVLESTYAANSETAARAQWQIAESYRSEGRYEQAAREHLRLATLFEQSPNGWRQRAFIAASECYQLTGDSRSARRMLRRSVSTTATDRQPANGKWQLAKQGSLPSIAVHNNE